MKMLDFLEKSAISINLKSTKKEDIVAELVDLLSKSQPIKEKDKLVKTIMNREALGSTGIGQGIGIPHAKSNVVKKLSAALGVSHKGVDFDSLDGEPTHIFLLLAAPEDAAGPHLKALARISRMFKDKFLRDSLIQAKSEAEAFDIIAREDQKL
jgi:nitrogen PTS system EIIA component